MSFSLFSLNSIIGRVYYTDNPFMLVYNSPGFFVKNQAATGPGKLPLGINAAIAATALCGTLAGQIFFGFISDRFGRKSAYALTLIIMIFAAIAQSMSFGTSANAVVGTLCTWRFILGFGIGGDYPICATIMSEFSNRKNRGAYVASVFAMQGIGILLAGGIVAITAACIDAAYPAGRFPQYATTETFNTNFGANNPSYLTNAYGFIPGTNIAANTNVQGNRGAGYAGNTYVTSQGGCASNSLGYNYEGSTAMAGYTDKSLINGQFCINQQTGKAGTKCATFACLNSVPATVTAANPAAVTGSYNPAFCPPCPRIAQAYYYSRLLHSCPPEADFVCK